MTLVLAKEHTMPAFREALFAGRTIAWSYDDLLGKQENVEALVSACLSLKPASFESQHTVLNTELVNDCPLNFTLINKSEATFQNTGDAIIAKRNSATPLAIRLKGTESTVDLVFEVPNAQIGFRQSLSITLSVMISNKDE